MIGDHQRASHSDSRRVTRSPYSSSRPAFDSYQTGRSQPLPRRTRRRARARARRTAGPARRGRTPTARRGWTIPYILLKPSPARANTCARVFCDGYARAMLDSNTSISDSPWTISSATVLPAPGPLLDPDRGRRPEAPDLRGLTQQRQAVVGDRQQPVDRVLHTDGLIADDLRHQLERDLHLRIEVVLRERQLGRRQRRLPRSTGSPRPPS